MYNTNKPDLSELPSAAQLVRSTLIALAAAAAILVSVVLPAEYAVDPTGIGRVLRLTRMGEIKQQLAEDADTAVEAEIASKAAPGISPASAETPAPEAAGSVEPAPAADAWTDEVVLTLKPDEAAEIKLTMTEDDAASYEWMVTSGHLNSDLHGDNKGGDFISYRKGRSETADAGGFTASFTGSHGWFWRNRSGAPVTLTLRVRGTYSEIKRVV